MENLQPKTFQCSLCSASFTRSTHLSRHLHTHTSERAHRCIACFAEFSRSDVLNRHIKTCKAINNQIAETVRHSRQKSCQACAQAKAKCDLQEPCSKCISRGKECLYINDPAVSRPITSSESNASSSTDFPFAGSAADPSNDPACSLDAFADAFLFPACTLSQSERLEGDDASESYGLFTEHRFSMRPDSYTVPCPPSDSLSVFDVPSSYTANYQTAPSDEAGANTELSEAEKQHYLYLLSSTSASNFPSSLFQ
ncbi:uncharacterized protein ARMOST_13485 [Armillaria ostoyae]|uniref:C2H2-type domain-containing protein n=1 Tax=Armillaria ostoyae TaxID=47428 RepID=A0A284RMV3_ARMOS|nr:uncharacterized protein ARMOST_13485 [Armillaria ostoyae]